VASSESDQRGDPSSGSLVHQRSSRDTNRNEIKRALGLSNLYTAFLGRATRIGKDGREEGAGPGRA